MKKVILVGCFSALLTFQCKKNKIVFANPGYSIGNIDDYISGGRTPSHIAFTYYIGAKKFQNGYDNNDNGWSVPASGPYHSGDKYMVQYDVGNPQTSRFLFNYPVKDSTDYKNDVTLFKTSPPQ